MLMSPSDPTSVKHAGLHWASAVVGRAERHASMCHFLVYSGLVFTHAQTTWPNAGRAWDLLHGVKVQVDRNLTPTLQGPDRQKRGADDAFGREKNSDLLQREAFGNSGPKEQMTPAAGIQDISTRMMAHMLGLDIPGIEPSTSYYPGYEWWPRATNVVRPPYRQPSSGANAPISESQMNANYPDVQGDSGWSTSYSYEFHGSPSNYPM